MDTTETNREAEEGRAASWPSVEETAEEARSLYQEIVDGMGIDAEVGIVAIDGTDVHLDAQGTEDEGGLLIGRHGQTLEAMQVLVGAIMGRHASKRIRIFLDAFGYRERRAESLRGMALEVADQVLASGQEALTEPLNAADRRIIHTALQEMEGITTYSEGEEPRRYVVISPSDGVD